MCKVSELCKKSLKEGGDHGLDSLRELSIKSSSCVGAYFESWVKFVGSPLVIPIVFEKSLGSKVGYMPMGFTTVNFSIDLL